MSTTAVQPEVNRLESATGVMDTHRQAVVVAVPNDVFALVNSEEAVSKPVALPLPWEQAGIVGKVICLIRRLRRRNDPPDYAGIQAMPTENPYDRAFSGHMMVHL
jgi:hypothetical protein